MQETTASWQPSVAMAPTTGVAMAPTTSYLPGTILPTHQLQSPLLPNTAPMMPATNTAALAPTSTSLLQNTAPLLHNSATLLPNAASLIQNSAPILQNSAALLQSAAPLLPATQYPLTLASAAAAPQVLALPPFIPALQSQVLPQGLSASSQLGKKCTCLQITI